MGRFSLERTGSQAARPEAQEGESIVHIRQTRVQYSQNSAFMVGKNMK